MQACNSVQSVLVGTCKAHPAAGPDSEHELQAAVWHEPVQAECAGEAQPEALLSLRSSGLPPCMR